MWACFCWLQKSWVCHLILKTMPSRPGLTSMLHSTIGLTAGSAERSLLHQWKISCGAHLHFRERTFFKSVATFDNNNHLWCLLLIWWHLKILKWTDATICTLTVDIMWLLTFLIVLFLLFVSCICNCVAGFVSSHTEGFWVTNGCSNHFLVPNRERNMSRLYNVTLLI